MKNIYNKFLIVSTIILFTSGVYMYLSKDLNSKDILPVAFGSSSLESSKDIQSSENINNNKKISDDTSFLKTLSSLNKISIDNILFENPSFGALKDNSITIERVEAGRSNPFAPLDSINNDILVKNKDVVTSEASLITDKTAVLNGLLNVKMGVTDVYFEYGNKQELGSKSEILKPSLVGTFIKNLSGLTPKTVYFFKFCAKINNVVSCGDISSFATK